jgi:hypothetical protein
MDGEFYRMSELDAASAKFFAGRPTQLELFRIIESFLQSLGEIKVRVGKSQISFGNRRQFAWVWLPMKWDRRRPANCIVLSFSLGRRIDHPAIAEVVEPYRGRFMHHVIMVEASDLETVKPWLGEAFQFGSGDLH